jgi:transglutaminase-like putative cysteine protease/tetratricopeptide (TPR) repeat protein
MALPARIVLLLAALVVAPRAAVAQSTASPPAASPAANADVVVERLAMTWTFDADGTRHVDTTFRIHVQSAAGVRRVGTVIVPYVNDHGRLTWEYVRVIKPDGRVVETSVDRAINLPAEMTTAAPEYSDIYESYVNVEGLEVGDELDYAVREDASSLIPGQFWMNFSPSWTDVVRDAELVVSVPAATPVIVKTLGEPPAKTTADGRVRYAWHFQNDHPLGPDEAAAATRRLREHGPAVQVTSFRSWGEVGDAILDLWRDRAAVTPAIRAKALALTAGAATDEARIDAIYRYVAADVRYVSVSFGIGRIQPHTADEVLAKGFGDCKDKHELLVALLDAIGVEVRPALLSTVTPPLADVPSPAVFDHVVSVIEAPTRRWLDTTLEVAPPGFLSEIERGQSVLLLEPAGTSHLVTTPAEPTRPNRWRHTLDGTVDDTGALDATVTDEVSGDLELILRQALRVVPADQWIDLVRHLPAAAASGGDVTNLHITPAEDTSTPLTITYRYTHQPYSEWAKHQYVLPLPAFEWPDVTTPRDGETSTPLDLPKGDYVYQARVHVPDDLSPQMPRTPALWLDEPFASLRVGVTMVDGGALIDKAITVKTSDLPSNEVEAYRAFVASAKKAPYYVDVPEWRWMMGSNVSLAWETGQIPAAREANERGMGLGYVQHDWAAARTAFDEATRADPDNPMAWALLGQAEMAMGDTTDGLAAMRHEVDVAPSPSAYTMLAMQLSRAKGPAASLDVWREAHRVYPENREIGGRLGETLLFAGRCEDAMPVLDAEAARQSHSSRIFWDLGLCDESLGRHDAATAAFDTAVTLEPRPMLWNNVAWELAVGHHDLDKASAYVERAVAETERLLAQPDAKPQATIPLVRGLSEYWDTRGWIHFQQGDFDAAWGDVLPAWDLSRTGVVADHLGQIAAARGDLASARHYYALALAATPPAPDVAAHFAAIEPSTEARERATTEARTTFEPHINVPAPPTTPAGAATFLLVVNAAGNIQRATLVRGNQPLAAIADALQGLHVQAPAPDDGDLDMPRVGTVQCESSGCSLTLSAAGTPVPNDPAAGGHGADVREMKRP